MARARRAASTDDASGSGGGDVLTCPECGKTFTRAASLGAHRNRAHGISGSSSQRRRRSNKRSNGGTTRPSASSQTRRRRGRSGADTPAASGAVNRDALLQTLFPNGLPAREEVIRRANAWLDEAERLATTS